MGDDQYILVKGGKTVVDLIEPDKRIVPLSWEPRIFLLLKNLLTEEECDHIVRIATPQLQRSTVVDGHGGGRVDPIRNSAGTFLRRRSDPVVSAVEKRLANITMLPVVHQEDMQAGLVGKRERVHARQPGGAAKQARGTPCFFGI